MMKKTSNYVSPTPYRRDEIRSPDGRSKHVIRTIRCKRVWIMVPQRFVRRSDGRWKMTRSDQIAFRKKFWEAWDSAGLAELAPD